MKESISIFLFLLIHIIGHAQSEKFWVFFNSKCDSTFNPLEYFDSKAIERRIKNNISLNHFTDLPVCSSYLEEVQLIVDSISHKSRWFNSAVFYGSQKQASKVRQLNFVDSVSPIYNSQLKNNNLCEYITTKKEPLKVKMMNAQLNLLGEDILSSKSLDGKGIRIAVFDAGFPDVNTSSAFKHLRDSNRIINTYDFVKNDEFVFKNSSHGTNVLSCIGGIFEGNKIGLATNAEFLLARTENTAIEPFSEEENWLAAVEWADKNGAQIINSSLAYNDHRYFKSEMNGQVSLVSRAANMAASKGILVVNAAGNDGANNWKYISTPGDADSVLTVGGINPYTNYHIDFSSFGPTADKRMKPNVCAYGEVTVAGNNEIRIAEGTSFSSPLIAGYAACIWQLHPEYTNMDLFREIEQSSSLYPYYDYAHGYGIPNANFFFEEKIDPIPTISFDETATNIIIRIKDGEFLDKKKGDYVFFHIQNNEGYLDRYKVVAVKEQSPTYIKKYKLKPGYILRAYYKGYVASYKM